MLVNKRMKITKRRQTKCADKNTELVELKVGDTFETSSKNKINSNKNTNSIIES